MASDMTSTTAWGVLYPALGDAQSLYSVLSLETDGDFIVGRGRECQHMIKLDHGFHISERLTLHFNNLSKHHFNIFRAKDPLEGGYSVLLTDLSSNGTFVNGVRVGKGNTVIVKNPSTISLVAEYNIAFVFVNLEDLAHEREGGCEDEEVRDEGGHDGGRSGGRDRSPHRH